MRISLFCLLIPIFQACESGPSGVFILNSQALNTLCIEFPSLQAALETLNAEEDTVVLVQGRQDPCVLEGLTITHKSLRIVGIAAQLQITACILQGNVTLVGWELAELDGQVEGRLTLIDC